MTTRPPTPPANALSRLLHTPRQLFFRRALFQVHLWTGLLLAAYLVIIAVTGSILVFEQEITAAQIRTQLRPYDLAQSARSTPAAPERLVTLFLAHYPGSTITSLLLPTPEIPAAQIDATDAAGHPLRLLATADATALVPYPRSWLDWTHDLHLYLLLGTTYGMQTNGVGGGLLLLASLSGLVVWWPGLRHWRRGFLIQLRARWRRINYDAHSAIGIWTLLLVLWWAFSGLYFGWYRPIIAAVNALSPLQGMRAPQLPPAVYTNPDPHRVALATLLNAARQVSPSGRLSSVSNATLTQPTVVVSVDLRAPGDFSHRDLVTLDATSGRVLAVWHYGQNHSLGDWTLWAMHPLHFGTLWGTPIKILYFLLGLSLAVLTLTGVLMYWNRYLGQRLRKLRAT